MQHPRTPLVLLIPLALVIWFFKGTGMQIMTASGLFLNLIGALGLFFWSEKMPTRNSTEDERNRKYCEAERMKRAKKWSFYYLCLGFLSQLIGLFIDPLIGFLIDP